MHCRTCLSVVTENYHTLDENGSEEYSLTLAEIIFEIAKIDTNTNFKTDFQYLCGNCVQKIKTAYDFVLQARKANDELYELQEEAKKNEQTATALEETPIPIYMPLSIKSEYCNLSVDGFTNGDNDSAEQVPDDNRNKDSDNIKVEEFVLDPIQLLNIVETEKVNVKNSKDIDSPDAETKPKLIKGKRGRPRKVQNTIVSKTDSKGYICDVCGKSFNWYKDLVRHGKAHYMDPKLQCDYCERMFLRKDKLKDHIKTHLKNLSNEAECRIEQTRLHFARQLYTKSTLKLIQCKLCSHEFQTIKDIRNHLPQHSDATTYSMETMSNDLKYINELENMGTEEDFKTQISLDFSLKKYDKYFAIVNEYGFELTLSDSDNDEDENGDVNDKISHYNCIVCKQIFHRKYQLFSHSMNVHANDKLPFKCEKCSLGFVDERMLNQHQRRQCENTSKTLQCSKCPGRFIWRANHENHSCMINLELLATETTKQERQSRRKTRQSNINYSQSSTDLSSKLQCEQCDKTFAWPKDLTRHMRLHLPDREKFACPICNRKFNRKDNMQVHMKTHGDDNNMENVKKDSNVLKQAKVQCVDKNLTKPHGYKTIECMLCQNRLMRKADLRAHLLNHICDTTYTDRWESIVKLKELIYPDISKPLTKEYLIARITADINSGSCERFYSITNEIGYELNISSSETDSDSDLDEPSIKIVEKDSTRQYQCDICHSIFDRKYKIFKHQAESHNWNEANYICSHCDARFISSVLLSWHQKRQCKNTSKRITCKKCPLKFRWKQNLEAHMRICHIPENTTLNILNDDSRHLQCQQCKRTFTMQKDLTRHLLMQTCRTQAEILKCLFCARKFYRQENLYAHVKRHGISVENLKIAEGILQAITQPNGIKKIYCRICNEEFSNISTLRTHLLNDVNSATPRHHNFESPLNYTITNSAGFEMQIDDSETDGENDGIIATANTIPKPPYQCAVCNLFAKRKYEMAQHQMSMHKYELLPFKCDKCIFRTVSQDILNHHMRSQCYNVEKQFQCDICHFKFMWMENLEGHKKQHHPKKSNNELSNNQHIMEANITQNIDHSQPTTQYEKPIFQCDQCPCKYNRKDRLSAHIKKVHTINALTNTAASKIKTEKNETSSNVNDAEKKAASEKKFLCAFCGRSLTSSSNLIIHMRRHTGEKPFQCDFCHMAFPRSSDLLAHRRKHTGERPHACTICDKKFSRSYKLMLHVRTHTGERPHKCTYCEKSFSQKNDLTLHIRRHTGQRPYACECGERFIQGTALRNHRTMRGHYGTFDDPNITMQIQE